MRIVSRGRSVLGGAVILFSEECMKAKKVALSLLGFCMLSALSLAVVACGAEDETKKGKVLESITLNTENVRTEFTVGDEFTYSGLIVTAHYEDETSAMVTGYTVTANHLQEGKLTLESDSAVVSYTEEGVTKTADYAISVTDGTEEPEPSESALLSIRVLSGPATVSYYVGETFSAEGLTIEATYEDETVKTVTTGFTANASTAAAGQISVPVIYEGKRTSFTIDVYDKLTSLELTGKRNYNLGDSFEGVTVKAFYNGTMSEGKVLDREDYTLTVDPALSGDALDEAGTYTVTVTYGEELIEGRPLEVSETFVFAVNGADAIAWGEEGSSEGEWKYWSDETAVEIVEVRRIGADGSVGVHAEFTASAAHDYGFQLFYNDLTGYHLDSYYRLTLTVTSASDCAAVINGEAFDLHAGVPCPVDVTFRYTYNGEYTGMSLFDMQMSVSEGGMYDITLSDIAWEETTAPAAASVALEFLEVFDGVWMRFNARTDAAIDSYNYIAVNGAQRASNQTSNGDGSYLLEVNVGDVTLTQYTFEWFLDGAVIATGVYTQTGGGTEPTPDPDPTEPSGKTHSFAGSVIQLFGDSGVRLGLNVITSGYSAEELATARLVVGSREIEPMGTDVGTVYAPDGTSVLFFLVSDVENGAHTLRLKLLDATYDAPSAGIGENDATVSAGGRQFTISLTQGQLVLTVTGEGGPDPDPDPKPDPKPDPVDPGDVPQVGLELMQIYGGANEYFFFNANTEVDLSATDHVTVNGVRAQWAEYTPQAGGYAFRVLVGDTSLAEYLFVWYDAAGAPVAQATYRQEGTEPDPDPDPDPKPEPQPGEVRSIEITGTEFYNDIFVKITMSEEDLQFLIDHADHVVTNGTQQPHGAGKGFLVDGTCIQIQFAPGETEFVCEWYDAEGNLIATCVFTK